MFQERKIFCGISKNSIIDQIDLAEEELLWEWKKVSDLSEFQGICIENLI